MSDIIVMGALAWNHQAVVKQMLPLMFIDAALDIVRKPDQHDGDNLIDCDLFSTTAMVSVIAMAMTLNQTRGPVQAACCRWAQALSALTLATIPQNIAQSVWVYDYERKMATLGVVDWWMSIVGCFNTALALAWRTCRLQRDGAVTLADAFFSARHLVRHCVTRPVVPF